MKKTEESNNTYEIMIEGHIPQEWNDWFGEMEIIRDQNRTILTGHLQDASALYGILYRLSNFNFTLISVKKIEN
jgi:hypothetical protein